MKTIILGSGFAGLGAGIALQQANRDLIILEASSSPGGMAKTDYKNGFYFDRGGHFLHFAFPAVEKFFCQQGVLLTKTERQAGIFIEGQIVPYPIQYNLWALSPQVRRDAFNEMKNFTTIHRKFAESADDLFSQTWGKTLTKIFFRPYNEKLWGRRLEDIPADCIGRYMPFANASLIEQGYEKPVINFGYNSSFLYPSSGRIGDLPLSMATYLNPQIKYNWPVIKIDLKQRTCVSQRGHPISYDFLISTIPLPELLRIAGIDFENNKIFEFTKLINTLIALAPKT